MEKRIKEIIVVEGRDDAAAVRRAIDADVIAIHGFGIDRETWTELELAYKKRGLIILTDPDHAGEQIRKRLTEKFPDAGQAFIMREYACKANDVGVENADNVTIRRAVYAAKSGEICKDDVFTFKQIRQAGLVGEDDSACLRQLLGDRLGIGYGNAKVFFDKLNRYGVDRDVFLKELEDVRRFMLKKNDR